MSSHENCTTVVIGDVEIPIFHSPDICPKKIRNAFDTHQAHLKDIPTKDIHGHLQFNPQTTKFTVNFHRVNPDKPRQHAGKKNAGRVQLPGA